MFHTRFVQAAAVVVWMSLGASVAQAALRDLFVSDFSGDIIRRYDGDTGAFVSNFTFFAGSGGMDSPRGIEFGPDGEIYINSSNISSKKVLKFQRSTGFSQGAFLSNVSYEDLYLAPDGNFYMTGPAASHTRIYRHNATTGAGGLITNLLNNGGASGITMGPDGLLYISTFSSNRVEKYNTSGAAAGIFATGVGNNSTGGLAFGPDGHLYVAGGIGGDLFNSGRVFKYHGQTGALLATFGTSGVTFAGPTDLEFGPDGFIYVSASGIEREVVRIDPFSGVSTNFVTNASGGLITPWKIAFDPGPVFTPTQTLSNGSALRMNVSAISNPDGGTAESIDLGTIHGLSVQAAAGPVSKSNTVTRQFTVDDGGGGVVDVFINALLDGQLNSDGGGTASVTGTITVNEIGGALVDQVTQMHQVNSSIGVPDNLTVNAPFNLTLSLIAGQTYELVTQLDVSADDQGGSAEALFDQTFQVEFAGVPVPEPGTSALLALGCLSLITGRSRTPHGRDSSRSRA